MKVSCRQTTATAPFLGRKAEQGLKVVGNTLPPGALTGKAYLCRMYTVLVSLLIGLFAALLFVNVYFRAKVLKTYGVLVRHRVRFDAVHVFNRRRLEEEVLPRYPHCRREIETFVRHIHYTIRMASVLLALITAFGAVLMYYR
jgi:hypothetical protein